MKRIHLLYGTMLLFSLAVAVPVMAEAAHGGGQAHGRAEGGHAFAHAAPRAQVIAPRAVPRGVVGSRSVVVGPRFVGPGFVGPRPYFYRPYYAFRPRLNVGFGLWLGYPVAYPYYYSYPYPYPYPYGYPEAGAVTVAPGPAPNATGGLSFAIQPETAEIIVDGQDFGLATNFSPNNQPLALAPGRHHIEVRAPGFESIVFDADIAAGQVLPYQGTMQPLN